MDQFRHALDLAKSANSPAAAPLRQPRAVGEQVSLSPSDSNNAVRLDLDHLERERIVAHLATHHQTRAFDMLRTQVLQSMETNGWQFLAITSPTAACGKTVTAINLAFSIARQPEREVLLVDLDLQKPKVAEYLGLRPSRGIMSALEGRCSLLESVTEVTSGAYRFSVLPAEGAVSGSAEWMASQSMTNVLQAIRREFKRHIVIFDMPPMLVGDDVISILPKMEAVLLIGGAGNTSIADIKECNKHLQSANVLRIVVNKVTASSERYAYY